MGTLFIDRADCSVELSGSVLTVRVPGQPPSKLPAALMQRVVFRSNTQLNTSTLAGLADLGVGILALGGRRGDRVANLVGAPGNDVRTRITQVRRLDDAQFKTAWSRRIISAKMKAQRRLIARALLERPDLRKPLFDALATLDRCLARLPEATDVDSLRGFEGAAAAAYFRAYPCLFPKALGFNQRKRRPPPDPVNACLSLGYTMLYGMALESCHARGLDPMLGYLHGPCHGRASLACDLMEPWRPHVDALVWNLFRKRHLEAEHFGRDGSGACLLGKTGRSTFYATWASASRPLRRALRRHAALTVRALGDLAPELEHANADEDWLWS